VSYRYRYRYRYRYAIVIAAALNTKHNVKLSFDATLNAVKLHVGRTAAGTEVPERTRFNKSRERFR